MSARREAISAILSLIVGLALSVVPLPASLGFFEPVWVPGLLLYWSVVAPHRFGLFTAFAMGLAVDVLTGALLGQNALALLVIVYVSQRFHLRIRAFPISQIAGTALVLMAIFQFTLFWIDGMAGRDVPALMRVGPALSTALLLTLALAIHERSAFKTAVRIEAQR